MRQFKRVTSKKFLATITKGASSRDFQRAFPEYLDLVKPDRDADCYVHDGNLRCTKNFRAPGPFAVVCGDLDVNGLLDLTNPRSEDSDLPNLFVVLGNVTCRSFVNEYSRLTFIDGNLAARDLILTWFEASALLVYGNLRTKFLYARDVSPIVTGTAKMDYGIGLCQRMKVTARGITFSKFTRPRHGEAASWSMLSRTLPDWEHLEPSHFLARLKAGRSVFRRRT